MRSALAASAMIAACAAGCLLTSDFDGIAGARPADDAGAVDDAAVEGGSASPCASGEHLVCTDFDHGSTALPVPGWNHATGDAGTIVIDESSSVSPPASLRAKVAGTTDVGAYLYRTAFTGAYTALIASFDVRIVSCPPQGNSLTLMYLRPGNNVAVGFVTLTSGVQAIGTKVGSDPDTFFTLEKQIPEGTWARIVLRFEVRSATTAHLTLTVDGQRAVDTDAPSAALANTAIINVGAQGSAASKGCEVAFDNVVLDRE
jgi:hypothetical protein